MGVTERVEAARQRLAKSVGHKKHGRRGFEDSFSLQPTHDAHVAALVTHRLPLGEHPLQERGVTFHASPPQLGFVLDGIGGAGIAESLSPAPFVSLSVLLLTLGSSHPGRA